MRHVFLMLGFFLWAGLALGEDLVTVETNPRDPIRGEVFEVVFRCKATSNAEPSISFKPVGFDVLGKNVKGTTTRTVYQNGKFQTSREIIIAYRAKAESAGKIFLRDVAVKIDGQVVTEAEVPIEVLDAPKEPTVAFVGVDVPEKSVYLGQGMTIRYSIYLRAALQNFDIMKFPKLDGFMKRFLQAPNGGERVTINGELFQRSTIYVVRVFPEREGELVVDPMEVSLTYSLDPFGGLGFAFGGGRAPRTVNLKSDPVRVTVLPLPREGRPKNFSGLVGAHRFELKVGHPNLIVNEPMDVRLSVSGQGALESYEAPPIWETDKLEKFSVKSDLGLEGMESAIKTFDYTYLAKDGGEVAAGVLELSYFDPRKKQYETVTKKLPALLIAGSAKKATAPRPVEKAAGSTTKKTPSTPAAASGVFVAGAPWWQQMTFWWTLLAVTLLASLFWLFARRPRRAASDPQLEEVLRRLGKGPVTIGDLLRALYSLGDPAGKGLAEFLRDTGLSAEAREYFVAVADQLQRAQFGAAPGAAEVVLEKKYLRELIQRQRGGHEAH